MRIGKVLLLFFIVISLSAEAFSQRNYFTITIESKYNNAFELFEKKKYGTAQPKFIEIIEELKKWT